MADHAQDAWRKYADEWFVDVLGEGGIITCATHAGTTLVFNEQRATVLAAMAGVQVRYTWNGRTHFVSPFGSTRDQARSIVAEWVDCAVDDSARAVRALNEAQQEESRVRIAAVEIIHLMGDAR